MPKSGRKKSSDTEIKPVWLGQKQKEYEFSTTVLRAVQAWWAEIEKTLCENNGEIPIGLFKPVGPQVMAMSTIFEYIKLSGEFCFEDKSKQKWIFPAYVSTEPISPPEAPITKSWDKTCLPRLIRYQVESDVERIYASLICKWIDKGHARKRYLGKDSAWLQCEQSEMHIALQRHDGGLGGGVLDIRFRSNDLSTKRDLFYHLQDQLALPANESGRHRYYSCPHCYREKRDQKSLRENLASSGSFALVTCDRCGQNIKLWDEIEESYAPQAVQARVTADSQGRMKNTNLKAAWLEGKVHDLFASVCQKFQLIRQDEGEDALVEWTRQNGRGTGQRILLQLKCGNSYFRRLKLNDKKVTFVVGQGHWAEKWQFSKWADRWLNSNVDVWLVLARPNERGDAIGEIYWFNATQFLKKLRGSVPGTPIEFSMQDMTKDAIMLAGRQYLEKISGNLSAENTQNGTGANNE